MGPEDLAGGYPDHGGTAVQILETLSLLKESC